MTHPLISADLHMTDPSNLFIDRMPKNLRDRAIRIEYSSATEAIIRLPGLPNIIGSRDFPNKHWDPFDPASDPVAAAIKDLDEDGVAAALLFPNAGLLAMFQPDHEVALAHARAFNDYVAENYSPHSDRFLTAAGIPLTDIDDALAEIERVARRGCRALLLPSGPPKPYDSPEYEPIWSAASANGMVIAIHQGTGETLGDPLLPKSEAGALARAMRFRVFVGDPFKLRIMELVGGGVLERHPNLHFIFVESNAFWLAGLMAAMDDAFVPGVGVKPDGGVAFTTNDKGEPNWVTFFDNKWPYPLLPSDYVRRQVHASFQQDLVAIANRHYTGVDCLVWGSDYPHPEGTNLQSRQSVAFQFEGVPEAERAAMTGGTLAKLFKFEAAAVDAGAS